MTITSILSKPVLLFKRETNISTGFPFGAIAGFRDKEYGYSILDNDFSGGFVRR
jgi:hypothetical protein